MTTFSPNNAHFPPSASPNSSISISHANKSINFPKQFHYPAPYQSFTNPSIRYFDLPARCRLVLAHLHVPCHRCVSLYMRKPRRKHMCRVTCRRVCSSENRSLKNGLSRPSVWESPPAAHRAEDVEEWIVARFA